MITLILIVALLVINAFFVAAEFALVKARHTRIQNLANSGEFGASLTQRIQQNLEAYLAACQLGITMASLGLGWVGEPFVAALLEPLFHSWGLSETATHTTAFILGFLIFSSLHITVGEQVPKTFAIRKAELVALWIAYPLRVFYIALYPLNTILNSISRSILAIFGVKEASHTEIYSSEEIEEIVSHSTKHGEIENNKGEMLNNLFKFDQLRVGRVMKHFSQVRCLDISAPIQANINALKSTGHSRFPLIDSTKNNELHGIILVKDLYNATLNGAEDPWENLLDYSRHALVVTEHQNVASLFNQMRTERAHFAIVVDEYGTLVGVITIEDLLEEIVGDIEDETDIDNHQPLLKSVGEGVWDVDGLIPLTDLEKQTGFAVHLTLDANTLSGFIMERLKKMPQPGDTIREDSFIFTVKSVAGRYVERVTIETEKIDISTDENQNPD